MRTKTSAVDAAPMSKLFGAAEQAAFARLSGDVNPMHLDAVAARRTQAGAPVVHGVHAALWAIDKLVETGQAPSRIGAIKAQFTKFLYVGSTATLRVLRRDDGSTKAELVADGLTTATIVLGDEAPRRAGPAPAPVAGATPNPIGDTPAPLDFGDLDGRSGLIAPPVPVEEIGRAFPHAAERLGPERVAAIALLSTLVGMVCPGLHSIFGSFAVDCAQKPSGDVGLGFRVVAVDDRFRMLRMGVAGGGVAGSVSAFLRQPPVAQAGMAEVARLVAPDEFAGSTALVVGGSRGLGALTAKVLAAGGARVVVTYATGREDADCVAKEIDAWGGHGACRVLAFDARRDPAEQLGDLGPDVDRLYYYATAHIFRHQAALFSPNRFQEFTRIYVAGFAETCRFLSERTRGPLSVLYPSSVFVESRPQGMTEYSMAKAAGEVLCEDMNRFGRGLRVIAARLPRLLTDQTAAVGPAQSADPLRVMLPIIRDVQARQSGG